MGISLRKPLRALLLIILIVGAAAPPALSARLPGQLSTPEPPEPEVFERGPDGSRLWLASGSFDPLEETLVEDLPQALVYSEEEASKAGIYILQFNDAVQPEWLQTVEQAGAEIGGYLPENAFLVRISPQGKSHLETLPFVRWAGAYQPAYKLSPDVDTSEGRSYRILLTPWARSAAVEQALPKPADAVFDGGLVAVLKGEQVEQISRLPEVIWIEPLYLMQAFNDVAGKTILGGQTAWNSGYTGEGEHVAMTDSGLDTGNPSAIHGDFAGRVAHIRSYPVVFADYGVCEIANAGEDDGAADKDTGHGTHVTGSAVGSGSMSGGTFRGIAYEAGISLQAVEQLTRWNEECSYSDGYYLTGIPADITPLLDEVYGWGARVHNNSWGGGNYGVYGSTSSQFDKYIHAHPDLTVVAAAGNYGVDRVPSDGYVDQGSLLSPGTAKNVITIGASDSERASGGYTSSWGYYWAPYFPKDPTASDLLSDSRQELAAFSSRGPTNDLRIKPDLVAPGTNIISVRSSQATSTGWGAFNQYYMYFGGTSMASPLAAGSAALVREYYRETEGHPNPSAALVKATLINTAVDITGYGNPGYEAGMPIPNNHEGWGLINVAAATNGEGRVFDDRAVGVTSGQTNSYQQYVSSGKPFKVTLVWSDAPAEANAFKTLVNDLDLKVTAPDGTTVYWGNRFSGGWSVSGGSPDVVNNVENVYVQAPATGFWKVEVVGKSVPKGPQPYAVLMSGNIDAPPDLKASLDVEGRVITPGEPFTYTIGLSNNGETSATGVVFTQTLPTNFQLVSLSPSCEGGIASLSSGFACRVSTQEIAPNTLINYTAVVSAPLNLGQTPVMEVTVSAREIDDNPADNTARLLLVTAGQEVFLPTLLNQTSPGSLPGLPTAPALAPINNPEQDGTYTLNWTPGLGPAPTSYELEENSRVLVTNYRSTSYPIVNKPSGTYTYRVRGKNASGVSPWSPTRTTSVLTILNGDSESGPYSGWTEYSKLGYPVVGQPVIGEFDELQDLTPHSGTYLAWFGGQHNEVAELWQMVNVPVAAPFLTYWYHVQSEETVCGDDVVQILINDLVVRTVDLCSTNATSTWVQSKLDLSAHAGETITLKFHATTDSLLLSNFFLDDVSFSSIR